MSLYFCISRDFRHTVFANCAFYNTTRFTTYWRGGLPSLQAQKPHIVKAPLPYTPDLKRASTALQYWGRAKPTASLQQPGAEGETAPLATACCPYRRLEPEISPFASYLRTLRLPTALPQPHLPVAWGVSPGHPRSPAPGLAPRLTPRRAGR